MKQRTVAVAYLGGSAGNNVTFDDGPAIHNAEIDRIAAPYATPKIRIPQLGRTHACKGQDAQKSAKNNHV